MNSIDFKEIFEFAPVVTVTMIVAGVGWWARGKSAKETIEALKDFIDYLKKD